MFLGQALYQFLQKKYGFAKRKSDAYSKQVITLIDQIEFDKGETVNLKGFSSNELKNEINTRQSLIELTQMLIMRPGVVFFFIVNVICISLIDDYELQNIANFSYIQQYTIPLTAGTIICLAKHCYFYYHMYHQDERVNERKTVIFKKLRKQFQHKRQSDEVTLKGNLMTEAIDYTNQPLITQAKISSFREQSIDKSKSPLFDTITWRKLEVGDIVVLQRNEICPADLLILETSGESCKVSTTELSGNTNEVHKEANPISFISQSHQLKGNVFEYRATLTGTIHYDISEDPGQFYNGYIRFKNDPQAIDLKKEHIFFREQMLIHCDYVYGIVLFAGLQSRYYRTSSSQSLYKHSFFNKKTHTYYRLTMYLVLFMTFLSWLIDFIRFSNRTTSAQQIATYMLQYTNFIPYYFFFVTDLVQLIMCYLRYNLYHTKTVDKQDEFHELQEFRQAIDLKSKYLQFNEQQISELSLIDTVIFDKTGTLTLPRFKVRMLFLCDTLFVIKHKSFRDKWEEYKEEVREKEQVNQVESESQSPLKQVSSVKVSQHHSPMSPEKKRLSLIPTWNLDKRPQDTEIEPPQDTSQQDEANFNSNELDDDHPRLQEVHKSRAPVLFRSDSPWGSQVDFQHNNIHSSVSHDAKMLTSRRKVSEKILFADGLSKKFSTEIKVFAKFHNGDLEGLKIDDNDKEDLVQDEKQIYAKLFLSDYKQQVAESLLSLALCHNTKTQYCKIEDEFTHEYQSVIDKLQLELVKQYDFRFICSSNEQTKYVIEYRGLYIDIPIQIEELNPKRLSVVVNVSQLKRDLEFKYDEDIEYIQYIRDDGLGLTQLILLDKEDKEGWNSMIHKMYLQGCRPIVYYKYLMTADQYSDFLRQGTTEFKERHYELIMVMGVAEKLRKQAKQLIKQMHSCNIQTFMASGDSLDKVLPIAYQSELLKDSYEITHFDNDYNEVIKQTIQSLYNQIKNSKRQTQVNKSPRRSISVGRRRSTQGTLFKLDEGIQIKSFSLLINGQVFDKIADDPIVMSHLKFLIFFCNQLIAYKMNQSSKALLLKILQHGQLDRKRVLVVGDNLNDATMFQLADFAIQFQSERVFQLQTKDQIPNLNRKNKKNDKSKKGKFVQPVQLISQVSYMPNTDLIIKNFEDLSKLLFYESRIWAEFYENLLTNAFYRSMLAGFTIFFLRQMDQDFYFPVICYQLFFFLISQLILLKTTLFKKTEQIKDFQVITQYYNQNKTNFMTIYSCFFYKIFLFSVIESAVITSIQSSIQFYVSNGRYLDQQQKQFQLLIIILILDICKIIFIKEIYITIVAIVLYSVFYLVTYLIQDCYMSDFGSVIESSQSILYIILMSFMFQTIYRLSSSYYDIQVNGDILDEEDKWDINAKMHAIQVFAPKRQSADVFGILQQLVQKLFVNESDMDFNIKQMLSGQINERQAIINKWTLMFENKQLENKFMISMKPMITQFNSIFFPISWFLLEVVMMIQLIQFENTSWLLYFQIAYNSFMLVLIMMMQSSLVKRRVLYFCKFVALLRLLYKVCYDSYYFQFNENGFCDILILQYFMFQPVIDESVWTMLLYVMSLCISFIIRYTYVTTSSTLKQKAYIQISYYMMALVQTIIVSAVFVKLHYFYRKDFVERFKKIQDTNQRQDTLAMLMPQFIRSKLNSNQGQDISINQGQVAILFCDICGFDSMIQDLKENVVNLLDDLFRRFDSLCSQYKLQKIETVGKTYMAAAGLKDMVQSPINPVFRAIQMAMDMQKAALECRFATVERVVVKIGIHYGYVIAGVIGDHKPQFSLIGDTVNTTSRLCSTGLDGQIKISEEAFKEVSQAQDWYFESSVVEAKGKGQLTTYRVTKSQTLKRKKKQLRRYRDEGPAKFVFANNNFGQQFIASHMNFDDQVSKHKQSIFEFRGPKKPSIIVPSLKMVQGSFNHKSSINLDQSKAASNKNSDNSEKEGASHQKDEVPHQRTLEGQTLVEVLELKLDKEQPLQFEQKIYYPTPDIEREKLQKLYQSEDDRQQFQDLLILDKKKLWLDFDEECDEDDIEAFYETSLKQNKGIILLLNFSANMIVFIQVCFSILIDDSGIYVWDELLYTQLAIGYTVSVPFSFYILKCSRSHVDLKWKPFLYQQYALLIWWCLTCCSLSTSYVGEVVGEVIISIGVILGLFFITSPLFSIKLKVITGFLLIIVIIIIVLLKEWNQMYIYYVLVQFALIFTFHFVKFHKAVEEYNNQLYIEWKYNQYDELVKYQLPKHVSLIYHQILAKFFLESSDRSKFIESFDDVSLLFADIVGFTEFSAHSTPDQVVSMLRKLFTEFDRICQESNVYKLYTIGDCYVVMGMNDAGDRRHAEEAKNIIDMGFLMIEKIKEVRSQINFNKLDMRIGIHTGSIIGGVLGTDVVRYDIYGPDVLIANKMESKGKEGKVHISARTKEIVELVYPEAYNFEFSQAFEFPSIQRSTNGYWVSEYSDDEVSMNIQPPK